MRNRQGLLLPLTCSLVAGGLVAYVAGGAFRWGREGCLVADAYMSCIVQPRGLQYLGLAVVVAGAVFAVWRLVLRRPWRSFGTSEPRPYGPELGMIVFLAAVTGLFGGGALSAVWTAIRDCPGDLCFDGRQVVLPSVIGVAAVTSLAFAVGVLLVARSLGATIRAALAVDVARLAAVPMLLLGGLCLVAFVGTEHLLWFGYGAVSLAAGVSPVVARRGGRWCFVLVSFGLALLALAIAVPAILVAPFLGGYGALLLVAAAVACWSPTTVRPYGGGLLDAGRDAGTSASRRVPWGWRR